jgi:hypothetical protein
VPLWKAADLNFDWIGSGMITIFVLATQVPKPIPADAVALMVCRATLTCSQPNMTYYVISHPLSPSLA